MKRRKFRMKRLDEWLRRCICQAPGYSTAFHISKGAFNFTSRRSGWSSWRVGNVKMLDSCYVRTSPHGLLVHVQHTRYSLSYDTGDQIALPVTRASWSMITPADPSNWSFETNKIPEYQLCFPIPLLMQLKILGLVPPGNPHKWPNALTPPTSRAS